MPVDHYENFPVASLLLPRRLRQPVEAIYRFARSADDIADEGDAPAAARLQALAAYGDELDRIERGATPATAEFASLATVVSEWRLPLQLLRDLLDAFAQDVVRKRYADYPELLDYCRRSANPVGRLLLHLVQRASGDNLRYSDCICSGLQLVNFWQDIALDWQKQRIYLPQCDLARFAIDEEQIAAARWSERWAALLDFAAHPRTDQQRARRHLPAASGARRRRLAAHRRPGVADVAWRLSMAPPQTGRETSDSRDQPSRRHVTAGQQVRPVRRRHTRQRAPSDPCRRPILRPPPTALALPHARRAAPGRHGNRAGDRSPGPSPA